MNDFSREIEIHAPVELCYRILRAVETHSNFSPDLQHVEHMRDNIWRWVMSGAHGDILTWDYQLVQDVPNQRLFWKSLGGPAFDMWSEQNLFRIGPDRTRFTLQISFHPHHMQLAGLYETLYAMTPEFVTHTIEAFKAYVEKVYQQTRVQEQTQERDQEHLNQQEKQTQHSVASH